MKRRTKRENKGRTGNHERARPWRSGPSCGKGEKGIKGRERGIPEFSNDEIATVLEEVVDLYGQIATSVVICWRLLLFRNIVLDGDNLWA